MAKTAGSQARGIDDFLRPDHLISQETKIFCQSLRKFVDTEVLPHAEELDDYWDWTERKEPTFVDDMWKKLLIDLGLQKSFMPPELGGSGGGQPLRSPLRSKKWHEAITPSPVQAS